MMSSSLYNSILYFIGSHCSVYKIGVKKKRDAYIVISFRKNDSV